MYKRQVTINDLLAENEKLEVRAKASEKGKMNDTMERAKLKSELDDITPFNAGKKKEEALAMLKKWFPQMENFSGQLKKYKVILIFPSEFTL